jgi:peptidylprolyl isomerase
MRARHLAPALLTLGIVPTLAGCAHDAGQPDGQPAASAAASQAEPPADAATPDAAPQQQAQQQQQPQAHATAKAEPQAAGQAAPAAPAAQAAPAGPSSSGTLAAARLPGEPLPEDCTFHTTDSGLQYAVVRTGKEGEGCTSTDIVTVHYTGYLLDGTRFDGTPAGMPARFPAANLIEGWQEALGRMTPGTKLKLRVPSELAYGETGIDGVIPPNADLVFDMELVAAEPGPQPRPAPAPLPVPAFERPADDELTTTESGLAYRVVTAGTGATPVATDTVTVHYAGWLTDGKPFDNSYERGEPASFPLDRVIAGWTEGLQLMREGGTSIFVIPSELAYGERGAGGTIPPGATLVFRVELLSIDG